MDAVGNCPLDLSLVGRNSQKLMQSAKYTNIAMAHFVLQIATVGSSQQCPGGCTDCILYCISLLCILYCISLSEKKYSTVFRILAVYTYFANTVEYNGSTTAGTLIYETTRRGMKFLAGQWAIAHWECVVG